MSRIGKQIFTLPEQTTIKVEGQSVTVAGPLGTLTRAFHPRLAVLAEGQTVSVKPKTLDLESNTLWGTYAAHLGNMLEGVSKGYKKELTLEGVGYRVSLAGSKLVLALGFSHPVELAIPEGLKVTVDKNNLAVSGADKESVGQFAALIRSQKPPEPYKGKGISYAGEKIRRKEGKKVTA